MVWVYVDASGHKIGKIDGAGGFLNRIELNLK
jgi:hypothetical protein